MDLDFLDFLELIEECRFDSFKTDYLFQGLRATALVGATGTAIGTVIKVFSIDRNNLWVVYIGQTILSSMQVFILSLPPRIAAVWFGDNEVQK